MSVIRNHINFTADFVQIPNAWMRDKRLSHRARGILAEIMTHSDGWEITVEHLTENGTEGRDAVRTAIKELAEYGYLEQIRDRDDKGRVRGSYYATRIPPTDRGTENRGTGNPTSGVTRKNTASPQVGPEDGIPVPGNPATKNTTSKNTKEEHQESPRKRGTRLDPSWMPSKDAIAQMREECPGVDLQREHRKFVDHFLAESGAKGTKLNWDSTWKNWIRKADEYSRRSTYRPSATDKAMSTIEMGRMLQAQADAQKGIER